MASEIRVRAQYSVFNYWLGVIQYGTRWSQFRRRYIQMHFPEWKCIDFNKIVTEVYPHWSNQQHSSITRAEEVVITRLRIGHTKATKSHILSRGPPTGCHHCGQTLTIDHMLLECALLQECRDEYYRADSLNALFEAVPETCIVEFLREAGFFYLIWCNLLISTSPQTGQYDRTWVTV